MPDASIPIVNSGMGRQVALLESGDKSRAIQKLGRYGLVWV